ncbi:MULTISPECIES: PAS domain-containing protein [unclassified Streptomyces]|uniref:PAS domain-containing protein n=1 Tax=unclassified Streptomyces TaxID=2593676 RepID=UPI000DC5DF98|nr:MULTISPECIES: PAS domain-containing protein [unclassified Streptomyces]RAJ90375.1 two-component system CheB/CheR fusion protein [Streptomyces sp. PsTaAH-137]
MNEEMRIRSEEMDEARSFLEGVLTSIAAAVVVLDQDFQVKSWNLGAADLWGLRLDEVLDEPFFGLDFGLPTQSLRAMAEECIRTGKRGASMEIDAVNRFGRHMSCRVQCSPFGGQHGGVVLLMEEGRSPGAEGSAGVR